MSQVSRTDDRPTGDYVVKVMTIEARSGKWGPFYVVGATAADRGERFDVSMLLSPAKLQRVAARLLGHQVDDTDELLGVVAVARLEVNDAGYLTIEGLRPFDAANAAGIVPWTAAAASPAPPPPAAVPVQPAPAPTTDWAMPGPASTPTTSDPF